MFPHAKKIHMIGIGGIGMSALAKLFLHLEKEVSGSDAHASAFTEDLVRRRARVHEGHNASHLADTTHLVIYSSAIPETNPERQQAATFGIPQMSYAQALGEITKHYSTIVVTGTHGKSTTTALLGLMLEAGGYDPTVLVGSVVPGFADGNLRLGKGRFFVVEGCEHQANMLNLEPEMIVLTSIEKDHLDYYRDLEHIRETFQTFVDKLSHKGLVILNADDAVSNTLGVQHAVQYGFNSTAHYRAQDRQTQSGSQRVSVSRQVPPENLGEMTLNIPGAFNVSNVLAATAAAMELGVPFEVCQRVAESFNGIWRRFERVGTWQGHEVISDYGHHPTAIRATVQAAREFFPDKKIVLCFQPHQHSRTAALFDEFVEALQSADVTVIPEIYRVEGRTETQDVSSRDLVEKILELSPDSSVHYAEHLEHAKMVLENLCSDSGPCIVVIQGAGNIDDLARNLKDLGT